jgi:hypothetical protein
MRIYSHEFQCFTLQQMPNYKRYFYLFIFFFFFFCFVLLIALVFLLFLVTCIFMELL